LSPKLAAARKRKRVATGEKVEGRKSHSELRPDVVKLANALARKKPKGGKLSLRAISDELAAQGFFSERGRPFNPKSIAAMLAARFQPKVRDCHIAVRQARSVGVSRIIRPLRLRSATWSSRQREARGAFGLK